MSTTSMPSVEEFEHWDDNKDDEAIAQAVNTFKVRHIIKNDKYYARTPNGTIYTLPIALSINDFEALSTLGDDTEAISQLKRIIKAFAGAEQANSIETQPVQVVMNLLNDYATIIAKTQGATLGK